MKITDNRKKVVPLEFQNLRAGDWFTVPQSDTEGLSKPRMKTGIDSYICFKSGDQAPESVSHIRSTLPVVPIEVELVIVK